ncbi:nucleotidyltransferase [Ensifer sp. MMN_5]|nr:nucleotidyltransferase [Ensifer sp. MMN_5]
MSKDVNEAFQILIGWLKHSEAETEAAASHRRSIEARLSADFEMTRMFRSGSYGHGTSLSSISDIDYFAVIPTRNLKQDSGATLRSVKESLVGRFPNTGIYVDSPAVVVPFSGGAQRHEIIPADYVGSENGYNVYEIPDRLGGWMKSSPSAHNAWVNEANKIHNGKLKQLIRLVKYWNHVKKVGLRSFYIELRLTEYAKGESFLSYKYDVKGALAHLSSKALAAMQDPQGISGYVYPCSSAIKEDALSKVNTALTRARNALEDEKAGGVRAAFEWWDKVFGGNFPSYY